MRLERLWEGLHRISSPGLVDFLCREGVVYPDIDYAWRDWLVAVAGLWVYSLQFTVCGLRCGYFVYMRCGNSVVYFLKKRIDVLFRWSVICHDVFVFVHLEER